MKIASGEFDWELYPESEDFIQDRVNDFLKHNQFAGELAIGIEEKTSTKFLDWVDHIVLPENKVDHGRLIELEFKENKKTELPEGTRLFHNPKSVFFPILVHKEDTIELALKPENIDDFCRVHTTGKKIQGEKFSLYRKLEVDREKDYCLTAVERRGYAGFIVKEQSDIKEYSRALELFSSRERYFDPDDEGLRAVEELVKSSLEDLHKSRVADAFFRAERKYWAGKNRAARVQKDRQDELGLGWGNHDHHTFRSSRMNFIHLIRIFELMGMVPRESFYAGPQAGWGAQVMEQPDCNIVVFADVDMGVEEKQMDFAHSGLDHRDKLGTVGLWVGLHGESILQAGMHHLAVGVDFKRQEQDLPKYGADVMGRFSNFRFLKQAFTRGENWKVDERRVKYLKEKRSITSDQFTEFANNGAIGSHLENIEREEGFKGFNQASVSVIISETDPRKQFGKAA